MFGELVLTPDNTDNEIEEYLGESYHVKCHEDKIRKTLRSGKTIYEGYVSFEEDFDYEDLYEKIWETAENAEDGNFKIIDGDLSY